MCQAKTPVSLGIRPVRSVLAVCMKKAWVLSYPLATHWADCKDTDRTGQMPRLSLVFVGCIWLLSKIKKFLSQAHRVQFYKSYIQPHIDFCNIVWGSSSESNKLKIFKLQKRACRIILDYNVDNINEAMKTLKIMSVYDRLYLRKA